MVVILYYEPVISVAAEMVHKLKLKPEKKLCKHFDETVFLSSFWRQPHTPESNSIINSSTCFPSHLKPYPITERLQHVESSRLDKRSGRSPAGLRNSHRLCGSVKTTIIEAVPFSQAETTEYRCQVSATQWSLSSRQRHYTAIQSGALETSLHLTETQTGTLMKTVLNA